MGLSGDLRNIKTHGGASAAELREFLTKMHGRSPQEVLGLVAESGLVRSTIQCTIGCIVLMVACSAIPIAWYKIFPPEKPTNATVAPATKQAESPSAETKSTLPAETGPAANNGSSGTDVDKAAKAMGIGDTKAADPKKNPRDKDLDKLLDDIK